jgi:hypothetical protein
LVITVPDTQHRFAHNAKKNLKKDRLCTGAISRLMYLPINTMALGDAAKAEIAAGFIIRRSLGRMGFQGEGMAADFGRTTRIKHRGHNLAEVLANWGQ